ncbi:MAG: hypothetical protein ACRENT_08715, partial [Thermodesulfobacteriota bacterium]
YEVLSTVEIRCKTLSCNQMNINQLEAHLKKTPEQYAEESSKNNFQKLAKDIEGIFGCIDGPYTEWHPTRIFKFFSTCKDHFLTDPEKIQKLFSIMEEYGIRPVIKKSEEKPNNPSGE